MVIKERWSLISSLFSPWCMVHLQENVNGKVSGSSHNREVVFGEQFIKPRVCGSFTRKYEWTISGVVLKVRWSLVSSSLSPWYTDHLQGNMNGKVSGSSLKSEVVFGERFIKSMVYGSFTGQHEWKVCLKRIYGIGNYSLERYCYLKMGR